MDPERPEPRRFSPVACSVVLVLSAYAGAWLISNFVWHQVETRTVANQRSEPSLDGVRVEVWANSTESEWSRHPLVPFVRYVESFPPFVVCLRLDDPERRHARARFASARLVHPDGTSTELRLVAERGSEPGRWMDFFPNASRFKLLIPKENILVSFACVGKRQLLLAFH